MPKELNKAQNVLSMEDLYLEMEFLPLVNASLGADTDVVRIIEPLWCRRPETAKIYKDTQQMRQEELLGYIMHTQGYDKYLSGAINQIGKYKSADIADKMENDWRKRTEEKILTQIIQTEDPKLKLALSQKLADTYKGHEKHGEILSVKNPPQPQDFLLQYGGVPYRPKGDISVIKAQAKSGKTSFLKLEIACMIGESGMANGICRTTIPGTDIPRPPYKVLWIDTEQARATSFHNCYMSVLRMADLKEDEDSPNLTFIRQRELRLEDRFPQIEDEVRHGNFDVLVVDGIRDVVSDINNPTESVNAASRLLQLAEEGNLSIIVVIHENPGSDTGKMRGWLGTELANKCFEVQQVSRDKNGELFTVENTDRRGKKIPNYYFTYNEEGRLVACGYEAGKMPDTLQKEPVCKAIIMHAFSHDPNVSMRHTDLKDIIVKKHGVSDKTAKSYIKEAVEKGYLIKDENRTYPYRLEPTLRDALKSKNQGPGKPPIVGLDNPNWPHDIANSSRGKLG